MKNFLIPCFALVLVLLPACQKAPPAPPAPAIRTDTAPLEKRLPSLAPIASARCEAVDLVKNNDASTRVPGPSDYRLHGLLQLGEEKTKELVAAHAWTPVTGADVPAVDASSFGTVTVWQTNPDFTKVTLLNGYHGRLYFSPENRLIYFDIMQN